MRWGFVLGRRTLNPVIDLSIFGFVGPILAQLEAAPNFERLARREWLGAPPAQVVQGRGPPTPSRETPCLEAASSREGLGASRRGQVVKGWGSGLPTAIPSGLGYLCLLGGERGCGRLWVRIGSSGV